MCSFDMGWQQRGNGHRFNSLSGHALLIGGRSRKPIAFTVKSKLCIYCVAWKKRNKDIAQDEDLIPPHNCCNNHDGSSSSMEPLACLEMVVDIFDNYCCIVDQICADDDTSVRAILKWSNADYMLVNNTTDPPMAPISKGPNKGKLQVRPDRGKLPVRVPEPAFVSDPNHRRKLLTGELLLLVKATADKKFTMTKMDMVRIGKNFAYMVRQLPKLTDEQYVPAGLATLEHHFDNHEYCGAWCRRKTRNAINNDDRFYRSKMKDPVLYSKLQEIVARYISFDRLKEVSHGMDTNTNESFNNTFSWLAPKNKVYCGTRSLQTRLSIGIGIQGLGLLEYFKRLFVKLGIEITSNVLNFLSVKEMKRAKRIGKVKLTDTKKQRLQSKYEQLKQHEAIAKKERAKREGTYKTGINMEDVSEEEAKDNNTPTRNRRTIICKHCGKKGHTTTRSKKCLKHKDNIQTVKASTAEEHTTWTQEEENRLLLLAAACNNNNDSDDVDNVDSIPILAAHDASSLEGSVDAAEAEYGIL